MASINTSVHSCPGKIINILTESGRLYAPKKILLDKNLRSDLE